MKKILCLTFALILCFCVCFSALAQQADLGFATADVPDDWTVASVSGALCAYELIGGGRVAFYDASSLGATPQDVVSALQGDAHALNIKASLLGGSEIVSYDLSDSAESAIIVLGNGQAVCIRYQPISDSELGLIVSDVAKSVQFN